MRRYGSEFVPTHYVYNPNREVKYQVSKEYMGLNPGKGAKNKNFAFEVLKVEISGPRRPHLSILDIPGTINNASNLKTGEKLRISNMVAEYMKQPENIVM